MLNEAPDTLQPEDASVLYELKKQPGSCSTLNGAAPLLPV